MELEPLTKLIKASQVQRNHLDALLVELRKDITSGENSSGSAGSPCHDADKTGGMMIEENAEVGPLGGEVVPSRGV